MEFSDYIEKDRVIKPNYYKGKSGQDVIDVIQDFNLGFEAGNIVKYLVRSGRKDGEPQLKDLEKAKEYLERLIKANEINK